MDYQIKSTPYFRRMVTTSKKNGQLQRLKEEYERMKEFNERAIEMKMRQVRLKRLFREIEEIKESTTQFPKRRRLASKSSNAIRLETLMKAKELGKEYSKINALLGSRNAKPLEICPCAPSLAVKEEHKKKLMAKAVKYGNASSNANLVKIPMFPQRASIKQAKNSVSSINENLERLKTRNKYGNSQSIINMSKVFDRKRQTKLSTVNDAGIKLSQPQTTRVKIVNHNQGEEDEIRRFGDMLLPADSDVFQSFDPSSYDIKQSFRSSDTNNDDESIMRCRASQHWHKLALIVRNRFDNRQRRDHLPLNLCEDAEFTLQVSENAIDLTQSADPSESTEVPHPGDIFDEAVSNEVLLNVQPLFNPAEWIVQPKKSSASTESSCSLIQNDAAASENVQKLAKIFEPYVRDAAKREAFDGVRKLKTIFGNEKNVQYEF